MSSISLNLNPANFSDYYGGAGVGTRDAPTGWISGWTNPTTTQRELKYAIYPNAVSGSESTYVCDRCTYDTSGVVLRVGGYYRQSQFHGAFYLGGSVGAAYSDDYTGSRIMELP